MKQHPPQNILLAALCLGLAACATHKPVYPEAPIKAPQPPPVAIGKIASAPNGAGFVLIQTTQTPAPGTMLQARSATGEETACLKVTPEQKPPFVCADIMKGKPQVGETVTK